MRLAVFGGTGGTGRRLIDQAIEAGHEVTALARDPSALGQAAGGLTVVPGDVLDPDDVRRAVHGADAVASALGIGMHRHATTVYSQGTGNVQRAMRAEGVRRLLVVSTSSLRPPERGHPAEWLVGRLLHRILARPYADMRAMERGVREADDLDWTLVRAARLTNGPRTRRYRVAYDAGLPGCWSISRADLAHYLLTRSTAGDTHRRVAEIAY
ncbi:NAD(P)-dependent oxidoreductase [Plantactinospora sp. KBS50]|uniref:NAD(P)-dependent oxidoreductase n=1 Tax=Plantactinospora sp. KBS50 TaxID=2024580 RepID=UPI000BAABC35|nr:NAD(P)H-binding protein [Plantactinospora sp. KBS50]ASW56773.1 hypothetical protein CIK06_25380 [Plantactinospora sp. KBS50]